VATTEVSPRERSEELEYQTDERTNGRDMNAVDNSEQTGIASQVVAELMKRTQAFLRL
jgi:hypothetical protein